MSASIIYLLVAVHHGLIKIPALMIISARFLSSIEKSAFWLRTDKESEIEFIYTD